MAAVLFGILIAFGSCKSNSKSSDDDDDEDEKTEKVDKKDKKKEKKQDKKKKKTVSVDDLDDVDIADFDVEAMKLDDLDDLDVDNLTSEQANNLLKIIEAVAPTQLPMDLGDGMTMTALAIEGNDLAFHCKMNHDMMEGMTMSQFQQVLNMPEMKKQMISSMTQEMDEDMAMFIKLTKTSGKNFAMKFIDSQTGEMASIRLTNSELNQFLR